MRCRLCEIPHRNVGNRANWIEYHVCRTCMQILGYFSYNSNYLLEYWDASEK